MAKIGRPPRLIAYDTDLNIKRRQAGERTFVRIVRARTVLYVAIIAAVGAIMLYALATRYTESISVIHDRNPVFVRLADGELRNGYTVRILNKLLATRNFVLSVEGLSDIDLRVAGIDGNNGRTVVVSVGPDQTREVRALVSTYQTLPPAASIRMTFRITDETTGRQATAVDNFRAP
jgi:polyferredoxin